MPSDVFTPLLCHMPAPIIAVPLLLFRCSHHAMLPPLHAYTYIRHYARRRLIIDVARRAMIDSCLFAPIPLLFSLSPLSLHYYYHAITIIRYFSHYHRHYAIGHYRYAAMPLAHADAACPCLILLSRILTSAPLFRRLIPYQRYHYAIIFATLLFCRSQPAAIFKMFIYAARWFFFFFLRERDACATPSLLLMPAICHIIIIHHANAAQTYRPRLFRPRHSHARFHYYSRHSSLSRHFSPRPPLRRRCSYYHYRLMPFHTPTSMPRLTC